MSINCSQSKFHSVNEVGFLKLLFVIAYISFIIRKPNHVLRETLLKYATHYCNNNKNFYEKNVAEDSKEVQV